MGLLVTVSNVGRDTFDVFQRLLWRITAGLGVATVFANAIFASITGISIASATVFSRVAVPEMTRHGYTKTFRHRRGRGVLRSGHADPAVAAADRLCRLGRGIRRPDVPGGVGPGILLSLIFACTILLLAKFRPGSFSNPADDASVR